MSDYPDKPQEPKHDRAKESPKESESAQSKGLERSNIIRKDQRTDDPRPEKVGPFDWSKTPLGRGPIERESRATDAPPGTLKQLPNTVNEWRAYFTANPETGTLTIRREGSIDHAYVPGHGEGRGANSGVTIGVGVEVRHQNREQLADALNANQELREYLRSVPNLSGTAAQEWVEHHPSPTLTPTQERATYEVAEREYSEMARDRLTGDSAHHRASESVRLTPEEYDSLHPRVSELITDIAINTAAIARGHQNDIAEGLQAGLNLQDVNEQTRAYEQLRQLRTFVQGLSDNLQGPAGEMKRLGWIDARMQELQPHVDPQYLQGISGGASP
jgi:hypothetical protein